VTQFTYHHGYHPSLNQVYSCAGTHFCRVILPRLRALAPCLGCHFSSIGSTAVI